VIIPDLDNDELRALVRMGRYLDKYLLVSRTIDGHLFGLLDEAQETAKLYQEQEALRGQRLFEFAIIYLGFALIIILAAMWLGLLFAERLSRPVGRLTTAAQQVGSGDLDVQVVEEQNERRDWASQSVFQPDDPRIKGAARSFAGKQSPDGKPPPAVRLGA